MSWLSGKKLSDKVKRNASSKVKDAFHGVFPIDELPSFLPHVPIFIIVNTQSHNLQGQHWKTIYINAKREGEIFDSLAQPPSELLVRWMNRFTRRWTTNRKIYQKDTTTTCGAFALYYILKRLDYPSLDDFTHTFSHSLYCNEQIVRSFYKELK